MKNLTAQDIEEYKKKEALLYKGNRLMGEFLGKKVITKEEFNVSIHTGENVDGIYEVVDYSRYHKDWNYIMLVLDKIEELSFNQRYVWIKAYSFVSCGKRQHQYSIKINTPDGENYLYENDGEWNTDKLMAAYDAILNFLDWYNKQK